MLPVAPPVFAYWQAVDDLRERLAGCGWCSPARRRCRASWSTFFEAHRRRRCSRATASPRRRRWSPRRCAAPRSRPGRSARRCPASRSGWSTRPAGRREGEDAGEIWIRGANLFSGYWPDGDRRPGRRGLVRHRRRRLPRPRRRPLPRRPAQGAGDRLRLQRLPQRGGGRRSREVDDVAEAAVIGAPTSETGEAVVAYVKARPSSTYSAAELEDGSASTARSGWRGSSSPTQVVRGRRAAATRSPARSLKGRLRERAPARTMGLLE